MHVPLCYSEEGPAQSNKQRESVLVSPVITLKLMRFLAEAERIQLLFLS